MLDRVTLSGFRACAEPTALDLGQLTVLAGANNTGKSSFIGALLSLVQSEQAASRHRLRLSGDWVDLGPFDELLSPDHQTFSIGVDGRVDGEPLSVLWDFAEAPARRDRPEAHLAQVEFRIGEADPATWRVDEDGTLLGVAAAHLLHPAGVLRVGADELRLLPYLEEQVLAVGPYRAPPAILAPFRVGTSGSLVGQYGQYAAEAFWQRRSEATDVLPPAAGASDTVATAMNAWWSHILGHEVTLDVEAIGGVGFAVRLDNRSLAQVGRGLSQLWPILVAGLASRPGDLVIIEAPEACLHPGAQHRVGRLLVELARRGRQVIVETHSEHVVAAASLAVNRCELAPTDVVLNFFSQTKGRTRIQRIAVDASGRRLASPEGFFDQAASELLELLGDSG